MAREKPKQVIAPIRDLTEADNALAEIAEIDRSLDTFRNTGSILRD